MLRAIALASVPLGCVASLLPGSSTVALAASSPLLRGFATPAGGEKSLVIEMQSDKELKELLKSNLGVSIIDFTAKWCGPCKVIAPVYEQLSKEHPKITFTKVDIDNPKLNETCVDHNITGVPTFVLYKAGLKMASMTGADKDKLMRMIKEHGV